LEINTIEVIFLSNAKLAGKLCGRIAVVFLALWFITQVTDLLGKYEYPEYFLGFVFLFFLASSILESAKYKVFFKKMAYGIAKSTFLIWLFIKIGDHFDWTGFEYWSQYPDYFIIAFFASILIGYTIGKHRRGARTAFYGIGFLGIVFWIFAKIFNLVPEYQTLIFFGSIAAVGIGYIVGIFEEERKLRWIYEAEDFEKIEEPKIKEEARVLKSDLEIKKDNTKINIEEGSIFVPVANGKEIGGVFFGQGSYSVDAKVKKYINVFQGITVLTGNKWKNVKKSLRDAEEKDFESMGLKKDEVFDLARIQIEEKEWKKIRKRFEKTVSSIDMPFIKVRETEAGDYVKVGPIEVIDVEGKGSRVKFGPFKVGESMEWEEQALYDISAKIRTKNKEISLKIKGDKTILKEDDRMVISKPNKVIIEDGDVSLKITENKRILKSEELSIFESEGKTVLKTPDVKVILNDELTIKKDGETHVLKNAKIKQEIKNKLDDLIRDILDKKEMKELDSLLEKLKQES